MTIDKGVWTWTGFSGAPGYSIFYATPNSGLSGVIKNFFGAIDDYIPSGVTISSPSSGDQIDEATGLLTGTWTGGIGGSTPGQASGVYAGPAGFVINWLTNGVVNGRRVRGRTFIVPCIASLFDNDGTLANNHRAVIQSAADNLVASAAGDLLVWHRPRGGVGGSAHAVAAAVVSDKVAVLRSRRD